MQYPDPYFPSVLVAGHTACRQELTVHSHHQRNHSNILNMLLPVDQGRELQWGLGMAVQNPDELLRIGPKHHESGFSYGYFHALSDIATELIVDNIVKG